MGKKTTTLTRDLASVPMDVLFFTPFRAALDAQKLMARNLISYINEMAYGEKEEGEKEEDEEKSKRRKVQTLDMRLEKPINKPDGTMSVQRIMVKPPLLGLVPVQSLLIDEISVNFSIEVRMQNSLINKSQDDKSVSESNAGVTTTGKISTQRENTRNTDKTAKYDVTLKATQQAVPEGMSKLMDLMASCVEPFNLDSGSSGY